MPYLCLENSLHFTYLLILIRFSRLSSSGFLAATLGVAVLMTLGL